MADPATFTFIRVADTETTGFPPHGELVEIGWTDLRYYPDGWQIEDDQRSAFVDPGRPIPAAATAIHHITDDMVKGAMLPAEARALIAKGPDILCAHNADFDRRFLYGHELPWICTMQAARKIWPGLPNHKNETIRDHLGIVVGGDAHRAGYDAAVTARILLEVLNVMSLEDVIRVSKPSYEPLKMPFGQHKGKSFQNIPIDYLRWVCGSEKMQEGIKAAARREIERRAAA